MPPIFVVTKGSKGWERTSGGSPPLRSYLDLHPLALMVDVDAHPLGSVGNLERVLHQVDQQAAQRHLVGHE